MEKVQITLSRLSFAILMNYHDLMLALISNDNILANCLLIDTIHLFDNINATFTLRTSQA